MAEREDEAMDEELDDAPEPVRDPQKQEIRSAARFLYDVQRVRIQVAGRRLQEEADKKVDLQPGQLGYMDSLEAKLRKLENESEKHLEILCKPHKMNDWLRAIRGIGPRMAGVILSEIDISRADSVSALWRYCGLAVVPFEDKETGESTWRAERKVKKQKLHYNNFLKTKLVFVLADSFIKSNSPYKTFYDGRKYYRMSQIMPVCRGCKGTGKAKDPETDKIGPCKNCGATGGPAPWGASKKHRDIDARRYMIKCFLTDLWVAWREAEGLPTRPTYAEERLGRVHHTQPSVEKA